MLTGSEADDSTSEDSTDSDSDVEKKEEGQWHQDRIRS